MRILYFDNYIHHFFIHLKKWYLLEILFLLSCSFFYFHLYDYLAFEAIKTYQKTIEAWTIAHYNFAILIYIVGFSALIACGIPCASILTLIGGFLFGTIALFYAVFSTTLGGMILFLAVRTSIGDRIALHSTGWIKKMEKGFQRNAFNYLLMLRLMPIFPCWISNISAGALNTPLKTFLSATIIGIFPATFIYVLAGRGLDKFLSLEHPHLSLILTPSILLPLFGLAILSLFPVLYKKCKKL